MFLPFFDNQWFIHQQQQHHNIKTNKDVKNIDNESKHNNVKVEMKV